MESSSESKEETNKKGKKNISSDKESDSYYNTNDEDVAKQQERYATLNRNALDFLVTKGISNGDRLYFVVYMGDTVWYNSVNPIKVNLEMMYERRNAKVLFLWNTLLNTDYVWNTGQPTRWLSLLAKSIQRVVE